MKKTVGATLALAIAMVLGFTASAMAKTGNGSFVVSNSDAEFSGTVYWHPNNVQHGGMQVSGNLKDINNNGDWVYFSAKVEGYGYNRLAENHKGKGGGTVYVNSVVYDGAATYVDDGYTKVCNNDAFGDTCAAEFMRR